MAHARPVAARHIEPGGEHSSIQSERHGIGVVGPALDADAEALRQQPPDSVRGNSPTRVAPVRGSVPAEPAWRRDQEKKPS